MSTQFYVNDFENWEGGGEGMLIILSYDVPSCSDIMELRTRLMMANEIHC